MKKYRGYRWLIIEDGTEAGARVFTRQVADGADEYLQIQREDGLMWRRATDADVFRNDVPVAMPQVQTEWVA